MESKRYLDLSDLTSKLKSEIELKTCLPGKEIFIFPKAGFNTKIFKRYCARKKAYIKCEDISVVKVPQYKGLRVNDLLKFTGTKINIDQYCLSMDTIINQTENDYEILLILLSIKNFVSLYKKRLRRES